jgi:hypothetical protein
MEPHSYAPAPEAVALKIRKEIEAEKLARR